MKLDFKIDRTGSAAPFVPMAGLNVSLETTAKGTFLMEQDHTKELEEIIGEIECPKNFQCCESGFEVLCKAKDVGIEEFLECLDERPFACRFSVAFGDSYYCQCPLRVYISKKLKK